jgi:hypothetical protein
LKGIEYFYVGTDENAQFVMATHNLITQAVTQGKRFGFWAEMGAVTNCGGNRCAPIKVAVLYK